jgi:hypothetical protein
MVMATNSELQRIETRLRKAPGELITEIGRALGVQGSESIINLVRTDEAARRLVRTLLAKSPLAGRTETTTSSRVEI